MTLWLVGMMGSGKSSVGRKAAEIVDAVFIDLDEMIEDFASVYEGCTEGVERTTALVEDLRTFSRLDRPEYTPVDLKSALDSTLRLLTGRLREIHIVREYAEVPADIHGFDFCTQTTKHFGGFERIFSDVVGDFVIPEVHRKGDLHTFDPFQFFRDHDLFTQ